MRVFAVSDVHIDYDTNAKWVADLSDEEFQDDVLILAGDVTDTLRLLDWCLGTLARKFRKVLFVPGNHELWVIREDRDKHSLQKFDDVCKVVAESGASMEPFHARGVAIYPLLGWYDYSFGEPTEELRSIWMDYRACRWPGGYTQRDVTEHFVALNDVSRNAERGRLGEKVITYSHFLPRIDLMPWFIPSASQALYPILGTTLLDEQLRRLKSQLHIYGHSHVNRKVRIDGVTYINNAFGYPSETRIASKKLMCVAET
ncbi:MAG TPA: metallophosphoesterase [Thermoanaerobaculia bacterium]